MRTLGIALVLGVLALAPATASAAAHGKKQHHARTVKHAKAKAKKARTQHAASARLVA